MFKESMLNDYVTMGLMTEREKGVLLQGILDKKNILIIGEKGSGKTTLANIIINEMALTKDRLIILEDIPEIKTKAGNTLFMKTTNSVNMKILLKMSLRYRPDRIIVGEICSEEALDLLTIWNTGYSGGVSTLTSDTAENGLKRLEEYVQLTSVSKQQEFIASAINYIVVISNRKIETIKEVCGFEKEKYILKDIE